MAQYFSCRKCNIFKVFSVPNDQNSAYEGGKIFPNFKNIPFFIILYFCLYIIFSAHPLPMSVYNSSHPSGMVRNTILCTQSSIATSLLTLSTPTSTLITRERGYSYNIFYEENCNCHYCYVRSKNK